MSFRFGFDLLILDILHLPSCLPSLLRFVLPGFIAIMKALTAVCVVLSMVCIVIFAPFDLDADRRRQGFDVQNPQLKLVHSLTSWPQTALPAYRV